MDPSRVAPVESAQEIIEIPSGSTGEAVSDALDKLGRADVKVYALMVYDPRFLRDVPVIRLQRDFRTVEQEENL